MPLQWHGDFRRNSVYKERQFQVVWAYVTATSEWIGQESSRSAIRVESADDKRFAFKAAGFRTLES
jgi:hypothetical protein